MHVIIDYCITGTVQERIKVLQDLQKKLDDGATIVRADATRDHIVYILSGVQE
jgi:hypothetical protein